MNCLGCGLELTGRKGKVYCNKQCQRNYEAQRIETNCSSCGELWNVVRGVASKARFKGLCRSCKSKATIPPPALSGSENANWRGGHKYWSDGRFGRDKDGLSWKIQRRLAWERDNHRCQHCNTTPKRNPDVHHINPWVVSRSHALDNLICLCRSCHLKLESTIQATWDGVAFKPPHVPRFGENNPNWRGGKFNTNADTP